MKLTTTLIATAAALLLSACGAKTDPAKDAATGEVDHAMIDHSGHDMGGSADSKLSEAQAAFKAANDKMHAGMADIPEDADIAFMQGMLAHHQGAVEMSEVALKYARDEQARDLAARVIAAQKEEIAEMEAWLKERGAR
ncbi:DUF305 domain-containing protein [Erythrobacter sp. HL-111]|uniref:CopM family metallochaperone n=1 Tax=Erythrobacter sp. HL-111 TaxID=1798193 RepID=UPI00055D75EB|nr:DUF305 domain-containing protein [Erythrobacter sp. HL-111]KPP84436.1 MAG: protein of unknown function containing DUF305 domain [Erythrobacteraceae bacterium HL-111]SDS81872.1 protein of unknown function [Erythrobacter sp. HL-111]